MAFYTNRHTAEYEMEGGFKLATINLRLADGRIVQLSKDSKRSNVEDIFGKPNNIDFDNDETILFYQIHNLTLEFEMQPNDGILTRMNLFPTED
jgi:hypothetical protein